MTHGEAKNRAVLNSAVLAHNPEVAGSNPVGATSEVAGQGPDRHRGDQALDPLSVVCPRVPPSLGGGGRHEMVAVDTLAELGQVRCEHGLVATGPPVR